jgi:hypothetical protein
MSTKVVDLRPFERSLLKSLRKIVSMLADQETPEAPVAVARPARKRVGAE